MFSHENSERQHVTNCNIKERGYRGGELRREWRAEERHLPKKRRKRDNDHPNTPPSMHLQKGLRDQDVRNPNDFHEEEPPNNFRDIPVFPELSDIQEGNRIFLRKNLVGKAYKDVDHYLDVQFRLLREDLIRPLRKGIAQIKRNYSGNKNKRDSPESLQFHRNVNITYINIMKKYGTFYRVHFDTSGLRYTEWKNATRLVHGCLLCLSCDNFKNVMFAVVADSNHKDIAKGNFIVELVQNDDANLDDEEEEENSSQESIEELKDEYCHRTGQNTKRRSTFDTEMGYTMVESKAYFEAYRHVLAGIKETHILPLEKYIVQCSPDMHPPQYLQSSGIEETTDKVHYDFSSITEECCDSFKNVDVLNENNWPSAVDLKLNETQAKALKLALTNKLAIIQGPPGTGKTYIGLLIMKILLANKTKWFSEWPATAPVYSKSNCPILITCFTNHALDQFLEGILKLSARFNLKIVRLGGRSKNEVTTKFMLKELRKRRDPVPQDIYDKLKMAKDMHELYRDNIDDTFNRVLQLKELGCKEKHLAEQFMRNGHFIDSGHVLLYWLGLTSDLNETEIAALQQANSSSTNVYERPSNATGGKDRECKSQTVIGKIMRIKKELSKTSAVMTDLEVNKVGNVDDLRLEDKWKLYRTWLNRLRTKLRASCDHQMVISIILGRRLQELRKNIDAKILQSADVIAATTTGAAKYRDLISELNCKIVVVEEAAEILEAHMITSMPKTTEHLILIGDHQQLKPSPTVYELAKKYKLDTSLFERMIPVIPHVTLRVQHRMRPSIADLLRPHIYEHLLDHESVKHKDNIKGITTAVYFLSHTIPEETLVKGTSKKNQHEADFLLALCKYIISQGQYTLKQITILAMYSGQLVAFQNKINNTAFENILVTTVDNFQGEENEIILLSLVRSNEEQKIGFLGIENRICVALSRAKSALYCIGNMKLLAKKSTLWSKIVDHLEETNGIGESLILKCVNHPSKLATVKAPEDFKRVPEGGCRLRCQDTLDCGHTCTRFCHPDDHSKFECQKPCERLCKFGHVCKKKCFEPCGACFVKVTKMMTLCGHLQTLPCSLLTTDANCKMPVRKLIQCGHENTILCHLSNTLTLGMCEEKCTIFLECGHKCEGSCFDCSQGRLHVPCMQKSLQTLVCGHACESTCNTCLPCIKKCETTCEHRKCEKLCGEPCTPCSEACGWKCRHFSCTKLCGELCDRHYCNKRCNKILECSHSCIGLCGEPCPDMCKKCDEEKLEKICSKKRDIFNAGFVQLEDCGHIFTRKYLDQWMNQEEDNKIQMKKCPECRTVIWKSMRYRNIINKTSSLMNKVKRLKFGSQSFVQTNILEKFQQEITEFLESTADEDRLSRHIIREMRDILLQSRSTMDPTRLILLEEKYRRLLELQNLVHSMSNIMSNMWKMVSYDEEHLENFNKRVKYVSSQINAIQKWVMLQRSQSAEMEKHMFKKEIERITELLKFIEVECIYNFKSNEESDSSSESSEDEEKASLNFTFLGPFFMKLEALLCESLEIFTEQKRNESKKLFKKISNEAPTLSSSVDIPEGKVEMIFSATGFSRKGCWYKCSEDHVYCVVDERGDSMWKSITNACPECQNCWRNADRKPDTESDESSQPSLDLIN